MNARCTRPAIPRIAWFAAGMWAGSCCAEALSWAVWGGTGSQRWIGVGIGLAIAVALGARVRPLRAGVTLIVVGLVIGVCASGLQARAWHRQSALAAIGGAREWTGAVEADPMPGAYGTTVRVRIEGGPLDGARARVSWPEGEDVPDLGRMVRFSAILSPLPADEPWARRVARTGACATGRAWRARTGDWRPGPVGELLEWRASALRRLHDVPGAGGDLLEGIVLGDRRRLLGTTTDEEFRILGLSHLVAVSGSHLALACGAVAVVGRLAGLSRRPLVASTVLAGAAYAVVTGMPYSALRSLMMLAVAGLSVVAGRRAGGQSALAVSVIAVLAVEPWSVFDLGFQLSVLAVAGLLLFGSLATAWAAAGVRGPMRLAAGTLALTGVAQVLTAPVVASTFGMMSLLAPVANAYAGPMVSAAMFVGLAGAVSGSIVPAAGDLAVRVAAAILGAAAWVAHGLARLPGAAVVIGSGPLLIGAVAAVAAGVWVVWPLPKDARHARRLGLGVLALTAALALGPAPARHAEVVVLDVGQGDAILVQDGGRTMLVDAGPDATVLRQALSRHGVRRVDTIVLTHAHEDHTAGIRGLSGVVTLGWIGVPGVGAECLPTDAAWPGPDVPVRRLRAGDSWRLGATTVRVLWPPAEPPEELHTNDTSVVLQVSAGEFDVVLTGDAEAAAQSGMLAAGAITPIEVLKVPHHGSTNGLTAEALSVWSPGVALVSVGANNRFGHPSSGTLELLEESGVRVMRTDFSGDLAVRVGRSGYRIAVTRRGERAAVRARMARVRVARYAPQPGWLHLRGEGNRGGQEHRGSQACLSDLRHRGAAARTRAPPFARPHRRGRGPRLQLRSVRW